MWMMLGLWACGTDPVQAPAPEVVAEAPPAEAEDWTHAGSAFTLTEAVDAAVVLADPAAHSDGPVRMRGELAEVCQKKGCWVVLRDDEGRAIRVTMKDHAFGVPTDSLGYACDVEGDLVRKKVDPERLAHYATEGATNHPEAGKTEAWELVASAVSTRP